VVRGLAINRFSEHGINILGGTSNRIEDNFIGMDTSGTLDRGNAISGVNIEEVSTQAIVGGTTPDKRNLISGNNRNAVEIDGAGGNKVQGNLMGTHKDGTTFLGGTQEGVRRGAQQHRRWRGAGSAQRNREALEERDFESEVVELERTARSTAEAADALGARVAQIVKSLVFQARETERPMLVLAGGANRVEVDKISRLLSEPVEMADAAYVREKTGFAIGGVPPVGHTGRPEAFVDEDLLLEREVWAAGHTHVVFGLEPAELVRLTSGQVVAVR
jgi:prolyl-tRNA editing enzyme YbaK/EbsC (Cys-tRNA(Pro) deacylase)